MSMVTAVVEEYYCRRYFRDLISLQMALVISRLFMEENAPRYLGTWRVSNFTGDVARVEIGSFL